MIGGPLLRTADGRLFLAAQLMDSLSAGISLVALPWLVLDAGGTQSQAGAAFLAGTLPYVALGLNAGHVGDHRPRRRVMVTGTAVQTAAAVVIPLALAGGVAVEDMPIALIYAAALVVTAGRVFVDAAAFGAIAKLVGGGHFVQGQSALSFVWSLGFLVGPAVGGALIGLVGISGALWVQAVGFAVAVGLMASMRVDLGPDPHPDDDGGEGVLAGLRLVVRDPVLRSLTAIGMAEPDDQHDLLADRGVRPPRPVRRRRADRADALDRGCRRTGRRPARPRRPPPPGADAGAALLDRAVRRGGAG
ncbi:MAG: MFS transporter, partial [Gaiellales bacterium]